MKVSASMDVKPSFLDFKLADFENSASFSSYDPKHASQTPFCSPFCVYGKQFRSYNVLEAEVLRFSNNSSDVSRKTNVSAVQQASLSLGGGYRDAATEMQTSSLCNKPW